jgi:hypothetical protein
MTAKPELPAVSKPWLSSHTPIPLGGAIALLTMGLGIAYAAGQITSRNDTGVATIVARLDSTERTLNEATNRISVAIARVDTVRAEHQSEINGLSARVLRVETEAAAMMRRLDAAEIRAQSDREIRATADARIEAQLQRLDVILTKVQTDVAALRGVDSPSRAAPMPLRRQSGDSAIMLPEILSTDSRHGHPQ